MHQHPPFVEKNSVAESDPTTAVACVRGALVKISTSCLPDFSIGAWSSGPQGMSRLLPPIVGTCVGWCNRETTLIECRLQQWALVRIVSYAIAM